MVIENQRPNFFETVDKVYIPIAMNSFSESDKYLGIYGIARITLGYIFIVKTNQGNNDIADQGQ